jgi:hypothetical protein
MSYYMQGDYYRGDPFFGALVGLAKRVGGSLLGKIGGGSRPGMGMPPGTIQNIGGRVGKMVKAHPVLTGAGAAGALMGAQRVGKMVGGHHCRRGTHISKRTGKEVCNRRMNVCNPRALRRSIRRAQGFVKLAMRTIHLVHPKKKGRFGGFKKRKKH